jgi:hypothetical protein
MLRSVGYLVAVASVPLLSIGAQDARMVAERAYRAREAAIARAVAFDEFRRASQAGAVLTDTLTVAGGNLQLLSTRELAPTMKAAASRVDTVLRRMGPSIGVVNGSAISVRLDSSGDFGEKGTSMAVIRYGVPRRDPTLLLAAPHADSIAATIENQTVADVLRSSRTPFARWFMGTLPMRQRDIETPRDWGIVRFDLLSSRSVLGRRCYKAEMTACSMLFGFTAVDDPVVSWYDSLARFDEVSANKNGARSYVREATEKCLAGNDAACVEVLHRIHRFDQPPSGAAARESLTREALRLGGSDAFARLIASPDTASKALAAAAGVPIDSVLRSWQRQMRYGSLGSGDVSIRMVVFALLWVGLLLVLVSRISRWR